MLSDRSADPVIAHRVSNDVPFNRQVQRCDDSRDDENSIQLHLSIIVRWLNSDTLRSALSSATISDLSPSVKSSVSLAIARYGTEFYHACG
jgi:hypothetical protein